jgi:hypothetical protein
MSGKFVQSLIVGVLVMVAVYIGLIQAFTQNRRIVKRAIAVFSASSGILVTLWLNETPGALEKFTIQIVGAGIAVVLALLTLAKKHV